MSWGEMCDVVIACRVSPSQKGEVVKLVRYGDKPAPMTPAIGDGANDVARIRKHMSEFVFLGKKVRRL